MSIRLASSAEPGIELSEPLRWPALSAAIMAGMNGCGSLLENEPKSWLNAVRLIVSMVNFVMSAETSTVPDPWSQLSKSSCAALSITG